MRMIINAKTTVKDGHHMYIYDKGKKTPIPDSGVVYLYINNGGMLKATPYADRAGSVHGKFIVTDEVTSKIGKPCIGGKTYDVWGIGENYVIVSARGDKRYIGSANAKKVVTHPNEKREDTDYKLIYDIYKMLQ